MRAIIIGANGQVGSELVSVFRDTELVPLTHADIEVCDYPAVRRTLARAEPDIVINTSAFHVVDKCEDEVERAFEVNAFAVRELALTCRDLNAVLVHFSTNFVFDGNLERPYTEADCPRPVNVYGTSKLAGENFITSICKKFYIIRTSAVFGMAGSQSRGGNFVQTMLRLAAKQTPIRVISDHLFSPTYTVDLAYTLRDLLNTNRFGIYHITNSGSCSWYDFALEIFRLADLTPEVTSITSAEYGEKAPRPKRAVLANNALAEVGLPLLRPWKEALAEYSAGVIHKANI